MKILENNNIETNMKIRENEIWQKQYRNEIQYRKWRSEILIMKYEKWKIWKQKRRETSNENMAEASANEAKYL